MYSDQQLYDHLSRSNGKELCGIFSSEQLSKHYAPMSASSVGFLSSLLLSGLILTSRNGWAQTDSLKESKVEEKGLIIDSTMAAVDSTEQTTHQDSLKVQVDNEYIIESEKLEVITFPKELETIVLGIFYVEPVPTFFGEMIDTTRRMFSGVLFSMGGKNPKQGKPASKLPLNNTDRPGLLAKIRNRFRRKRKK